jgi:hypothetical protein
MAKGEIFGFLIVLSVLCGCGEGKETCTCTCVCGSGQKSTIDDASSEDDCASSCDSKCGDDSYSSSYDCHTQGASSETPTGR